LINKDGGAGPGDLTLSIFNEEGLEISQTAYSGTPDGSVAVGDKTYLTIPSGGKKCFDIQILVPENLEPGDHITFAASLKSFYTYDAFAAETLTGNILSGQLSSDIVLTDYYGETQTDKASYTNDESVMITGQAIDRVSGLAKAGADLKIGFELNGFKWYEPITTDQDGNFQYQYNPSPGISGEFIVWAAHPLVYDVIDQNKFDLYRMYLSPKTGNINAFKGYPFNYQIGIYNPGTQILDGFTLSSFRAFVIDDQFIEQPVAQVSGDITLPVDFEIDQNGYAKIDFVLSAAVDAPDFVNIEYTVMSSQGAVGTFTAIVNLFESQPTLEMTSPASGFIDITVDRGNMRSIPVSIQNTSMNTWENAELTLPSSVTWMTSNRTTTSSGAIDLGNIEAGETITFDVLFTPPQTETFGYHKDVFQITGSNPSEIFTFDAHALVSSDKEGAVQFTVYNILGRLVPDAIVRLSNPIIREDLSGNRTDIDGFVLIEGLQEGEWSYQVSAPGHGTQTGVVTIIPGQTADVEPELDKSLVTINFSVVPVPFTDRYEILIEQTFETHVPMPVLVMDPPVTQVHIARPGLEATFIIKVSNFGLKAVDDVTITTADSGEARWEPLISYIPRIEAQQTIEVPFKFTYRGTENNPLLPGNAQDDIREAMALYKAWKRCVNSSISDTYFSAINNLVAVAQGHAFSEQGKIKKPVRSNTSVDHPSSNDIEPTIDMCTLAKDECVEYLSAYLGEDYAKKVCDKAGSALTGIPPVKVACGFLERIQKAYELGKKIGCFEKVYADFHDNKPKGKDKEEDPTTGGSASDAFFDALDPGKGKGFGPCQTCGPAIAIGTGNPESCFAAGTPIQMADGNQQPIESIRPGDSVVSFDGTSALVSRIKKRETDHIRELRYKEIQTGIVHRIRTTDEHQFWIMNHNDWALAADIRINDTILLSNGTTASVIETVRRPSSQIVYNFDVAGYQSYFANNVLVYQECGGQTADLINQRLRAFLEHLRSEQKISKAILPGGTLQMGGKK
ncbi:MAG: polymorphic toxin-type HINT domain-containing protein, partial [Desulfobacterales bacterium]|nr:polymorphic toxin-type HINT domain-containing protein [Desulfobacterales bacterium]